MSYFDISIDSLQNSETFANAIADNIVPKNGKCQLWPQWPWFSSFSVQ